MKIMKEFKTFAVRGNVVDMAVGVIMGAAFGKIVSSVVADVIMPPIGLLIGGVNFTDLAITLRAATAGNDAVTLNYGHFLQTTFDFVIIAFAIFMLVKGINILKTKEKEKSPEPPPPPPPPPSKEEMLLTEIRDLLKNKV